MDKTEKLSSLTIFMPAYNEESNIQRVVQEAARAAKPLAKRYEVLVINDGSKDKTAEKVRKLQEKDSHIRLISHEENLGYGAAVKTGLKNAGMDWIFFTDSDGQFNFRELGDFVKNRSKADLIIGYRRKRQDPLHRIIVAQILLKIWNRVLFGLKVKDVDCAYKLFKRDVAKKIILETESAITVTEFLVRAKKKGYTFYEIPVVHYPRRHGTQTGGNIGVIFKAARESLHLFFELRASK